MKKMAVLEQIKANGGTTSPYVHKAVEWYNNRVSETTYLYAVTNLYLRSKF